MPLPPGKQSSCGCVAGFCALLLSVVLYVTLSPQWHVLTAIVVGFSAAIVVKLIAMLWSHARNAFQPFNAEIFPTRHR